MDNASEYAIEYEKCAMCGTLTEVKSSTPIKERVGYIEGAGQICTRCDYTNKQYRIGYGDDL